MAPAKPPSMAATKRCRSKRLSVNEPPASASASAVEFATCNEVDPGPGTVVRGASQRLKPKSMPNRSWLKSKAATATTARPIADAKREFLPGCTSARPRAARHKAVEGFMAAKPEPQLDSSGISAHQPKWAAAAIVTATKPVA